LSDEALRYVVRFSGVRRLNLRKFPYRVFYFGGNAVVVLGVLHGARDTEEKLKRRRQAYP
jgi:hypothetical protein